MKRSLLSAVTGFVVFACVSASAGAAEIAIVNPGFEDPVLADGEWVYGAPGWIQINDAEGSIGTWNPDATGDIWYGYGGIAPEGQSVGWAEGGSSGSVGLGQVLAETLTPGMTYTLTVEVGNNFYYAWKGYKVQLLAGGTLLAEDDTNVTIAADAFETSTVIYDGGHPDLVGEPLEIRLLAKPGTGEADFDDVKLFVSRNYRASNPDPADGSLTPPSGSEGDGYYMLMTFTPGYGATTHTAYFSSNFDDVNDRNPAVSLGSPPYPGVYPTGYYAGLNDPAVPEFARTPLERGMTYYWAVDESNDTATYPGHVWSYTIPNDSAWTPSPADGEQMVVGDPSLTLSWLQGDITDADKYVISFNVYWGIDRAAVEAGTSDTANVTDPTHIIGPLSNETDYYWKVDTVLTEKVPPNTQTIIDGSVWQFKTGPEGAGTIVREVWNGIPGNAVSALTSDPRYPANPDSVELLTSFEGPSSSGAPDEYGSRIHGLLLVAQSGFYRFWIATDDNGELWLSTNERPGGAVLISWVGDFAGGGWARPGDFDDPDVTPSGPIYLEGGKRYYIAGLMKEGSGGDNIAVAWEGPDSGDERVIIPGKHLMPYVQTIADSPKPVDGAIDVSRTPTLEWRPGIFAAATNGSILYYSYDADAVANRTATSVTLTNPSYTLPLTLDLGQTFYWVVDTVNGTNSWPGDVWSFKVVDGLVVDDMESYTPWTMPGNNIFEAWRDGEGNCTPGNGNDTGSVLTENIDIVFVHGGLQSMKYDYDNDGLVYSPCTMTQTTRPHKY
ncbi:MAG: PA14 domain-containing protein, partial [Planctomycetota bacterium]